MENSEPSRDGANGSIPGFDEAAGIKLLGAAEVVASFAGFLWDLFLPAMLSPESTLIIIPLSGIIALSIFLGCRVGSANQN